MQVKDRVLEALEANRGTYFSGEALAQKLAVSRSAVWKAIQQLRESGYPIEAASKRGYCLAKDSAILSAQSIAQYLTVPQLRLEVEQLVSSTNTLLRQRAEAGEPEGLALVAAAQTAGRGRRDHTFFSPPDTGLYLSFLVRPQLSAKDALLLTTCAAAAVALAIEDCAGVPAEIKWVNDVFCRGKKVCGILTEGALDLETGGLQYAIVGIGVNCFPPAGGFPEDLPEAGSVFAERPQGIEGRSQLAGAILNHFFKFYPNLALFRGLPQAFPRPGEGNYGARGNPDPHGAGLGPGPGLFPPGPRGRRHGADAFLRRGPGAPGKRQMLTTGRWADGTAQTIFFSAAPRL